MVSFPPFSPLRAPWIGVWREDSRPNGMFTWPPAKLRMEQPNVAPPFCLSAACSFPRTAGLDVDPTSSAPNQSRRMIEGIGPIAVAALALFSTPPLSKSQSLVIRVSPMFALGGAGIELRGRWW
jgi:hypothetical protein